MAMHIKRIIVPYLAQKPNTWEDNWNLKDGYNDEKYNVEWSNS
jgi:hypothetical protein